MTPAITVTKPWEGVCPVQAEGTIDGHPWYFRARGDIALAVAGIGGNAIDVYCGYAPGHVWRPNDDDADAEYPGWMSIERAERITREALATYPDGPGWEQTEGDE
jgi:hypothetical protein